MSEFRVHHHVNELLNHMGVPKGEGADHYVDLLLRNTTGYVTTQVSAHSAKRKIAEFTRTPNEFLKKYEDLKAKNVRELDSLVYLTSRLVEDKDTLSVLGQKATDNPPEPRIRIDESRLSSLASKLSEKEMSELRSSLMSLKATDAAATQSPESLRRSMREKQAKKNTSLSLPVLPSWIYDRPNLSDNYVHSPGTPGEAAPTPLGQLPLLVQESAILEDLLYVMMGIEGRYIQLKETVVGASLPGPGQRQQFSVDPSLDVSLQEMTTQVLPLCANYSTIVRFIEEKASFEYGTVNHALCSAMRNVMKEYLILVAQLEHQARLGRLSLQKFWFYLQPSMQSLELVAGAARALDRGGAAGGSVLSQLHQTAAARVGDLQAHPLCLYLAQVASLPYLEMLEKWIYQGIIRDPYCEFMIEEDESVPRAGVQIHYNDLYWGRRYTICRERIPVFLEAMAEKILNTGKYLDVIRQCGQDPKCPSQEEIVYTLQERRYAEVIESAHAYASQTLLGLLIKERELLPRLRSIKHYFLMDQGDFFVQFMDIAESELKKDAEVIVKSRLESLLELALRTSLADSDPFKDDLKVVLCPYDLITQLLQILALEASGGEGSDLPLIQDPSEIGISGLEALSFDYLVRWPESLVINRKALTKYQMLFRHLFYTKHVERQLCNVWVSGKSTKEFAVHSAKWYAAAFALRVRMLHFVQNFQYYMMFEVIEPNWLLFEEKLKTVSNIDNVIEYHIEFLDKCLKDCLLTKTELIRILQKLMSVCITFCNFTQKMTAGMALKEEARTDSAQRMTAVKAVSGHFDELSGSEALEATIANFDQNFSSKLIELLDQLGQFSQQECEHTMVNIIYRLNFNNFYSEDLEKLAAEHRAKAAAATADSQQTVK